MGEPIQSKNQYKNKNRNRNAIQKQSAGPKTNPKAILKLRKQSKNNPPKAQNKDRQGILRSNCKPGHAAFLAAGDPEQGARRIPPWHVEGCGTFKRTGHDFNSVNRGHV